MTIAGHSHPSPGQGVLERHAEFPTRFVDRRNVDVWLPPAYALEDGRRFPVIYMHDGQNLFDTETAYGGIDWGIDEAVARLAEEGTDAEAIVVGIWNTDQRWREYMPQKALSPAEGSPTWLEFVKQQGGEPYSDRYLRFVIEEVKPFVDSRYRTLPERDSTFVMGSSMGGLISLYALCEYPGTFSGAGCLSTHWPAGEGIVIDYLRRALPRPGIHRIYFDYGTATLDALYEEFQGRVDQVMQQAGYREGIDWLTLKFLGDEHSEAAWRKRVHIPLRFLLAHQ